MRRWLLPFFSAVVGCGPPIENVPRTEEQEPTCEELSVLDDVVFDPEEVGVSTPSGHVAVRGTFEGREVYCSAFVIAPSFAVSAGHCAPVAQANDASIVGNGELGEILALEAHPELDVMVLQFAGLEAQAVPVVSEVLDRDWSGRSVVVAGHGRTDRYQAGALHFTTQGISSIGPETIEIDTAGAFGACEGDSGGALLARDDDGRLVAIGVLSTASLSCRGRSTAVRLDQLRDWLPELPAGTGTVCDGLETTGVCDAGRAMWCSDDARAVEECAEACGWNELDEGLRCLDEPGECGRISARGECDGDVVTRCVQGRVESADCAECGASCIVSPGTGVAGCVQAASNES